MPPATAAAGCEGPPPFPVKKKHLFQLLALLLSLGIALMADFSVRHIYLLFHSPKHGRVADPVFDHGYRPEMAWTDRYGGFSTPFFSNSLGFRDGEIRKVPLVSDKRRVLLIGDSFTEGVGVPWEDTLAGRLQRAWEPAGIEVLNAGVGSYTPLLEKVKLRHLLETVGLKFDRVVLLLDLSDIRDDLFYRETPDGRAELIPYGPFASEAGWGAVVEDFGNFSEAWIEPNFALLGALSRNLKLALQRIARKELGKRGAFTYLPDFIEYWDQENAPRREIAEAGILKLKENLGGVDRLLRNHGIPWMLVIYPWPQYRGHPGKPTRMQEIWREWTAQHQIQFLDLFPVFARLPDFDAHFIPGDCHWNARGHEVVASQIREALDGSLGASP